MFGWRCFKEDEEKQKEKRRENVIFFSLIGKKIGNWDENRFFKPKEPDFLLIP